MALARFGGGVAELRGSIAGNVFSRSRAGAIVRNRAVPVNPNTIPQQLARSYMQQATDGFFALTAFEIDSWNTFASTQTRINRLGETYVPSGKQLYMECSINQQTIGGSFDQALGPVEGNPNLPSLSFGDPILEVDATSITSVGLLTKDSNFGDVLCVQATGQMQPSINNVDKYFRSIGFQLMTEVDWTSQYEARFETTLLSPTPGNVIHFRASAVNSNTGLASSWVHQKAIIPELGP